MKKFIFPIIATLVGTCFVTYSFLDTFIIPKNTRKVSFTFDESNLNIPIGPALTPSSSSDKPNESSNNSSGNPNSSSQQTIQPLYSHEYYPEQLTVEEISKLFTQEAIFIERGGYSDPDIYINITTHRDAEDTTTYYVADLRVRNLSYFRAGLAHDTFGQNVTERTSDICTRRRVFLLLMVIPMVRKKVAMLLETAT